MGDMDDLYQEIIIDHYKHPRHAEKLADEDVLVDRENPTCGDQIKLFAKVEDGVIADLRYEAIGCAISVASASMMADALKGKPLSEATKVINAFIAVMRGEVDSLDEEAGDLLALEGVKKYPLRIKCATMSWHALADALQLASS